MSVERLSSLVISLIHKHEDVDIDNVDLEFVRLKEKPVLVDTGKHCSLVCLIKDVRAKIF